MRSHQEADNPYQDFLKFYTLKEAVYDLAKCWDELPLSIIENSYNNILKRELLQDGLARDFEGFRDEQPRARAGFEDIVVGEQPTVDFDSQIQTNGRVLDNEVQELVSLFNGLAHESDCEVPRQNIFYTNYKFIKDDL